MQGWWAIQMAKKTEYTIFQPVTLAKQLKKRCSRSSPNPSLHRIYTLFFFSLALVLILSPTNQPSWELSLWSESESARLSWPMVYIYIYLQILTSHMLTWPKKFWAVPSPGYSQLLWFLKYSSDHLYQIQQLCSANCSWKHSPKVSEKTFNWLNFFSLWYADGKKEMGRPIWGLYPQSIYNAKCRHHPHCLPPP